MPTMKCLAKHSNIGSNSWWLGQSLAREDVDVAMTSTPGDAPVRNRCMNPGHRLAASLKRGSTLNVAMLCPSHR